MGASRKHPQKYTPRMPLNDRQIKNAKPTGTGKKAKLFDGGGLYLEVTPAGGKIFRLKYRIDGKEKTLTIGKYPAVSLSEARQAAENARRLLSDGQDPAAAKQQAKQERRAALLNTFSALTRRWNTDNLHRWNTELRGGRWTEIDFQAATWTIPVERMKHEKTAPKPPHTVPLSDWALELLQELQDLTGNTPYLFPSRTKQDGHISENTLGKIMNGMGYKGIATPHGFRSLASSILNEQGYNPDAIERQLAHVEENRIQAFLGGIVLKTLTVYKLFLRDYHGDPFPAEQKSAEFFLDEICAGQTLVMRNVIISWAEREGYLTLRQSLARRGGEFGGKKDRQEAPPTIIESKPVLQIEYRPLEPKYPTPEFEVACEAIEAISEVWNKQEAGVKPQKEEEIQYIIREKLKEETGVEPSKAAIARVDTLTRPPIFKNQQKSGK